MPVIQLPVRRERELEPIHRTPPRVGIFDLTQRRRRSTGPQAHLHPYVLDTDREVWRQVGCALRRCALVAAGVAIGVALRHGGGL